MIELEAFAPRITGLIVGGFVAMTIADAAFEVSTFLGVLCTVLFIAVLGLSAFLCTAGAFEEIDREYRRKRRK